MVLKRGAVNARPWEPKCKEDDGGARKAPTLLNPRLTCKPRGAGETENARRNISAVVDCAAPPASRRKALLEEPDGFQVERPRPPRRACGVCHAERVVVLIHRGGEVGECSPVVSERPAFNDLVSQRRPWEIADQIDRKRECNERCPNKECRRARGDGVTDALQIETLTVHAASSADYCNRADDHKHCNPKEGEIRESRPLR